MDEYEEVIERADQMLRALIALVETGHPHTEEEAAILERAKHVASLYSISRKNVEL